LVEVPIREGPGGLEDQPSTAAATRRLWLVAGLALLWALIAAVNAVITLPPAPGAPGILQAALSILPGLVIAGLALAWLPAKPSLPLSDSEARLAAARQEADALEASLVRLDSRLVQIAEQASALAATTGTEASNLLHQAETIASGTASLASEAEHAQIAATSLLGVLPALTDGVETIRGGLSTLAEDSAVQVRAVEAMLARVQSQNEEATSRADSAIAALASHFTRLDQASKDSTEALSKRAYALDAAVDGVLQRADTSMARIAEALDSSLARLDTGLDGAGRQLSLLGDEGMRLFGQRLDALIEVSRTLEGQLASHGSAADTLQLMLVESISRAETLATPLEAAADTLAALDTTQQRLSGQSADLTTQLSARLADADAALARFAAGAEALEASRIRLRETSDHSVQTVTDAQSGLDAADTRLADLAASLAAQFNVARAALSELEAGASRATISSQRATEQVTARLLGLVESVSQTEARIDAVETRFAVRERNTLARDASGLMAGLSATIGDLAQLLQLDVPEADWRAWLRGDRSTLPALIRPLLDGDEQQRISRHVAHDPAFRAETTRFLDQFEQLISRLLGDRDGDALAATMLSADIGKLYIRLADAAGRIQ